MPAKTPNKNLLPSFIRRLLNGWKAHVPAESEAGEGLIRDSEATPTQIKPEGNHEETAAPVNNMKARNSLVHEIDISDMPDDVRHLLFLPPRSETNVIRVDPQELAIAELNFPGPLGQHYEPNSASGRADYVDDDPPLPLYNWATLSTLPLPVKIEMSWPNLYAAQREKSKLLEIQEYISTRIGEIDSQTSSFIQVKQRQIPTLELQHLSLHGILRLQRIMHPPPDEVVAEMLKLNVNTK